MLQMSIPAFLSVAGLEPVPDIVCAWSLRSVAEVSEDIMTREGFNAETIFYRITKRKYLNKILDEKYILRGNPNSRSMIGDEYREGSWDRDGIDRTYIQAAKLGWPGLNVTTEPFEKKVYAGWDQIPGLVRVRLRLGDLLKWEIL
jgi:hypothetical protein